MRQVERERGLRKGTILQKAYRIKKTISTSELSNVYVVYHMKSKRTLILKEFFPQSLAMRDLDHVKVMCRMPSLKSKFEMLLESFWQEASLHKELKHANIIGYIDHFAENGTGYLVVDYCKGKTLDEYVFAQAELDVGAFLHQTVLPLFDGLDYLHKKGIIHRDIKPKNILVTEAGQPVLIDFGSAIYFVSDEPKPIVTTEGYSPLEFYSGLSKQGVVSDIYSLAATLYYCLTKERPVDVALRVIEDHLPSLRTINPEVPLLLANVIMWGLAVDSKKRCPTLKLFATAIRAEHLLWKGKTRFSLRKLPH
ncbi:serine/threonine-protein kinase [Brevibacillus fortis]|uniref:serine/threonine protein kinase n=1 Tax=Brevibacillus fortis TaxID=2126352 RepID=UPI002E20542E|nr:serine/threonine-protein kinase [Brevibacillus fortis]